MEWQVVVGLNVVTAACYFAISTLILLGLVRTRQLGRNPLALATAAIFTTCGLHHAHHAAHLMFVFDTAQGASAIEAVREVFGEWHSIVIDAMGAAVAIAYLGLRHSYKTLLNTPAMFEDAVRIAAERHLREVAFTDQLTGVPNRAAYQQYADRLGDTDEAVTVLFIDLDDFKSVNDRFGHDAGDRLLRDLARRLADDLDEHARLFRIGGDEFVVLAHGPGLTPVDLAGRALNSIVQPVQVRDRELVVGASIGAALGLATEGVDRLLREADADMYRIKARRDAVPQPRGQDQPTLPARL